MCEGRTGAWDGHQDRQTTPTRYKRLRQLGISSETEVDHRAGKALQRLVDEVSRKAVRAALDALTDENVARSKWSPPLRRLLTRHVAEAWEAVTGEDPPEDILAVYIPSISHDASEAQE